MLTDHILANRNPKYRWFLRTLLVLGTLLFSYQQYCWSEDPDDPDDPVIARSDNPEDAASFKAYRCESSGDHDGAIAAATAAIHQKPIRRNALAWAYHLRGEAWRNKGEFDKAISDYTESIRINPKYHLVYDKRGLTWIKKGELDKAIADFTVGIKLASEPPPAIPGESDRRVRDRIENGKEVTSYSYLLRGIAWQRKGELDKAIADFTEAVMKDPRNSLAYSNRGTCYSEKGEKEKAEADFTNGKRPMRFNVDIP